MDRECLDVIEVQILTSILELKVANGEIESYRLNKDRFGRVPRWFSCTCTKQESSDITYLHFDGEDISEQEE